ncbi:uncharacterized protein LOC131006609 [Salvia miltiorrhiza]|uniref:uncharacterized protein LOC131006609 n=1 Tax=Salvia miltiorrhiza TaxID=226208 RepID=UPI0025AC2157|nr:uncharacterized protein LOC131006609 [Salvia miltiorrhiza]
MCRSTSANTSPPLQRRCRPPTPDASSRSPSDASSHCRLGVQFEVRFDATAEDLQSATAVSQSKVARCTKIINPNTGDAKYIINVKQIAMIVGGVSSARGSRGRGGGSSGRGAPSSSNPTSSTRCMN